MLSRPCLAAVLTTALGSAGCTGGPLAPQCERETGIVLETTGTVSARATAVHTVTSPRHSNLIAVLGWPDPNAALGLRATMIACGEHAGCQIGLVTPGLSAGSAMLRLLVDGTRGKQYIVEVTGDPAREQIFTLRVTYDTGICT